MLLNRTNIVLSALLILVALMTIATRVDYAQPNIEVLPDMKYSPAWTAYASNPIFENGRTLQAPVAGTIPRGHLPLHFEPTKEDAVRAGQELSNPYHVVHSGEEQGDTVSEQADAKGNLQASIQRGNEAYRVFCTCCHGATGAGDGPVTKRGFPPPPSLLTGKSREMKDGQLFHLLTYGQASMPDFRGQISKDLRWDLVNYLRDMQAAAGDPAPATPPADASESLTPSEAQNERSEEIEADQR